MGIKSYRPLTPGQRFKTGLTFEEITRDRPEKSLTKGGKSEGRARRGRPHQRPAQGRRAQAEATARSTSGATSAASPRRSTAIEYDPNRSAFIALLVYTDGEKRYIVAPAGVTVGRVVVAGPDVPFEPGNALPLEKIPLGMAIHNIELNLGRGGQLARSAGTSATIVAKEGDYVTVRLPSGEMRLVNRRCYATIGELGNKDHMNVSLGKAGRSRWKGRRPKVRGTAMNPVDHPHGGGEGKTKGGRHPVTPWGQPTKGYKTRKKRNVSSRFIVKRRK